MFVRIPHIINSYQDKATRSVIKAATFSGIENIATNIMYALLPILLSVLYNEMLAGIIISSGTLIQLFVLPISGELVNRFGAIKVMRCSYLLFFLTGILFLLIGLNYLDAHIGILLIVFLMFLGYGLRSIQSYVLQMSPKNSGGLLFGIVESIIAIGVFIATLLIPYFENQSLKYIGIVLIISMLLIFFGSYYLMESKIKNRKKGGLLNILSHIKKGFHFIKVNKTYPIFHLLTVTFEGIFYASIWFLIPLLITKFPNNMLSGISLGIYEIITIFLGGFFGWVADRYNWKKLYLFGWIGIIIGIVIFNFTFINILSTLVIGGIFVGIGNNMIYGGSSHILEQQDKDHREDGSFIALQKIVSNLGYFIMPVILGTIINIYSIQTGFTVLTYIVIILGIGSIILTLQKKFK